MNKEGLYKGKYENSEKLVEHDGWTREQVGRYLQFLDTADPEVLREILKETGVQMFRDDEPVDEEQAVLVLCRQSDVKKEDLFRVLDEYIK